MEILEVLESHEIDTRKIPHSHAYVLGIYPPYVEVRDARMLVLLGLERGQYVLPGNTPTER